MIIMGCFNETTSVKINKEKKDLAKSKGLKLQDLLDHALDEALGLGFTPVSELRLTEIDNEIEFQFNLEGKKASKETLVNEKQFDPTTYEDRISELEDQDRKPKEQSPAISADNEVAEKIKSLEEQLAKEKEKNKKLEKDVEFHKNERNEMLKELLSHIIHKESDVEEFLELVDGRSDPEIIDIVKQWGTSEKITRKMKNRPLWQILHAAKIYKTGEPNWNAGLRKD